MKTLERKTMSSLENPVESFSRANPRWYSSYLCGFA